MYAADPQYFLFNFSSVQNGKTTIPAPPGIHAVTDFCISDTSLYRLRHQRF
jgi:hypothetical protein